MIPKVIVLGKGGREHALADILQREGADVHALPGSDGMDAQGITIAKAIDPMDYKAVLAYAVSNGVRLIVPGPEAEIIGDGKIGIADFVRMSGEGISMFAPDARPATVEGSKLFAKQLLGTNGIPTAEYESFDDYKSAVAALDKLSFIQDGKPIVIKADGLCAGKGVVVAANKAEAVQALEDMLVRGVFGEAGKTVLIEEFLGYPTAELSSIALVGGGEHVTLPFSKDHKRIGDGDTGKNTGGMGAYSFDGLVSSAEARWIEDNITRPLVRGMQRNGLNYVGFLYVGLMKVGDTYKVLEINCRGGDPETEVILPRISGSFRLREAMLAACCGELGRYARENPLVIDPRPVVGIVTASAGYPDSSHKGDVIAGLSELATEGVINYHMGTTWYVGNWRTNGGRVMCHVLQGHNGEAPSTVSQKLTGMLMKYGTFEGRQMRSDIQPRIHLS